MAQIDQVGQAGFLVPPDRCGDLDHREEGQGALLHPGSAGGRAGQQRQALAGGAFHGVGQAVRGGHADGAAEETELADDQGNAAAPDQALAGEHRFVLAGLLPRRAPGPLHRPR